MKKYVTAVLILILSANTPDATAASLKPETLKGWEPYVQLTEKRIEGELDGTAGFLRTDYVKPANASAIRGVLKNGQVYIEKLNTTAPNGKEIPVPDGLIHHWFGSIFVPKIQ